MLCLNCLLFKRELLSVFFSLSNFRYAISRRKRMSDFPVETHVLCLVARRIRLGENGAVVAELLLCVTTFNVVVVRYLMRERDSRKHMDIRQVCLTNRVVGKMLHFSILTAGSEWVYQPHAFARLHM